MSFSISWITSYLVALDSFFRLLSLACFLPKVPISFSWFGTSFHFVVTNALEYVHWSWSFFLTPHTYHGFNAPFVVWSFIQFSTWGSHFHYGKVKGTFSCLHIHTFFKRFTLITLSFLFMEVKLKVESRICGYKWNVDLMIVCFSYLFYHGLLIQIR